ncbi:MAG: hypothetical protein RIR70_303 [Pseudomonadota bacterium]
MKSLAQLRPLLASVARSAQAAVLGAVIVSASVGVYYFGAQVQQLVTAIQAASSAQAAIKAPQASVEKKPLPPAKVQEYHDILRRLHPAVTIDITQEGRGLSISVPDVRLYSEWMFALYSLQSYGKSVLWEADRVCLKECGGPSAVAVVHGYVQSVQFK